mgnify:FL=1
MDEQQTIHLKVAVASNPSKVATAIAKNMQEGKAVETISIGAGAANQSIKAIIIARGITARWGMDLAIRPSFLDLEVDGEERTAIKLSAFRWG